MNSEKVNDWLQIVGMFGIMASLVFVGLQVRQTQAIGEGESASQYFQAAVAGKQLVVDHADVWIRGCMGEELSNADQAKVAHLFRAYSIASYFAWLGTRHNILDLNPDDVVYPYAANIHRYPGFAQLSSQWRDWAEEGLEGSLESSAVFREAVMARVAELKKIEPDPRYDVKWCGM